jgi:hypothetical protein
MDTRRRCSAIAVGLALLAGLVPAALAAKPKLLIINTAPLQASVPSLSFDALSSAAWAAGSLAALPASIDTALAPKAAESCFLPETSGAPTHAVFSATAIGPVAEDATNPRAQPQEPFNPSEPATYSLVLAGIGLIVTIARRRM